MPESGLYLALSRCRSLEGIGLSRPIKNSDIIVNAEALEFMENTEFVFSIDKLFSKCYSMCIGETGCSER